MLVLKLLSHKFLRLSSSRVPRLSSEEEVELEEAEELLSEEDVLLRLVADPLVAVLLLCRRCGPESESGVCTFISLSHFQY